VLLVEHALIKTRHALKVLHDQTSRNDVIAQRFINEARAAGTIGHRNVVEVTHVDQVEGGGPWYLVMKYLEGQTLTRFLASRRGPLDQRSIVHIAGEALNGLQAAHDRRIVHRDLKPDNLYLTAVKDDPYRTIILDFGVAQLGQDAGVRTGSGAVIGTPQYMSPEQHRGALIDHRADLWAMGAIVYEMATGWLPYQGDGADRAWLTAQEIFLRMMTRPVVDPRHYNPALTEGFASATLQALQPDPAHRMASARQLAVMLADATPGDAHGPSGRELLLRYADELVASDAAQPGAHRGVQPNATEQPRSSTALLSSSERPIAAHLPTAEQQPLAAQLPIATRLPIAAQLPVTDTLRVAEQLPAVERLPITARSVEVTEVPDTIGTSVPSTQMSTLGATASQLISPVTPLRKRPLFMVGIGVITAVVACAAASLVLLALREPRVAESRRLAKVVASDSTMPDAATPDAAHVVAITGSHTDVMGTSARAMPGETEHEIVIEDTSDGVSDGGDGNIRGDALKHHDRDPADARVVEVQPAPVAKGELKVVVLPWAEVWLDGKRLGQAPILGRKVPAGKHTLRIKNDAAERTFTITVTPSRLTVVDEKL
jgi:serine/threonine protein kinase